MDVDYLEAKYRLRAYRFIAFSAIGFSVISVLAICVTLPLAYNYINDIKRSIDAEVNYCKVTSLPLPTLLLSLTD